MQEIRDRLKAYQLKHVKIPLMFEYVTACRISEVCGKYAVTGKDVEEEKDLIKFSIKTAKKKGELRIIAIPRNPEYEPLMKEIMDKIEMRIGMNKKLFNITPRTLQAHVKHIFNELKYEIRRYYDPRTGSIVKSHFRTLTPHSLRHFRATELVTKYGFTAIDLSVFCGWKLSRTTGMSNVMDRYMHLSYGQYVEKLFKPFSTIYPRVNMIKK